LLGLVPELLLPELLGLLELLELPVDPEDVLEPELLVPLELVVP